MSEHEVEIAEAWRRAKDSLEAAQSEDGRALLGTTFRAFRTTVEPAPTPRSF